jgi:predicted RNA-binding Zn-ribbon protein involved in translation (DUF1610 family)
VEEIVAISIICPSCQKKLSAPDSAAGKKAKCPACGTIVVVPQIVHDAEEIGATEVPSSGPPVTQPAAGLPNWLDEMMPPATPPPAQAADDGGQPRRPCPECGELIVAGAAKCRFCGAVFDPGLKRESAKKKRSAQDENLTTSDWIICILCAGIGCIGGIIYAIQGKPKGMKMVGISILAAIVWNVLYVILQTMLHQGPHAVR